jgi:hypothetical protein
VQREAHFLSVPTIVLRKQTEWPELLRAGTSRLAFGDFQLIFDAGPLVRFSALAMLDIKLPNTWTGLLPLTALHQNSVFRHGISYLSVLSRRIAFESNLKTSQHFVNIDPKPDLLSG